MIKIENNQVFSTDGLKVRRIGTDTFFSRSTTLSGDTPADFEEVDPADIPAYNPAQYAAEVERLIALRYTTGQEIQFSREQEAAGKKYTDYLAYVADCKDRARQNLADPNA